MSIPREIVLDTETTGLEPSIGHRIVEIGAVEMEDRVPTGRIFHFYINPERDMPAEAYKIHGISAKFLADKPKFYEIADDFIHFIQDAKLIIHNAAFDIKFLNHELTLLRKPCLNFDNVIDTLTIARRLFPGSRASLDALCKRLKIDNSSRKFHGALLDATLLAEVYIEMMGGRQEKFEFKSIDHSHLQSAENMATYVNNLKTKIIYPTSEELVEHKKKINTIKDPIWTS